MTIENRQLPEDVKYSDLFSNVNDQLLITDIFQAIINTREKIRDTPQESLPGLSSGPHVTFNIRIILLLHDEYWFCVLSIKLSVKQPLTWPGSSTNTRYSCYAGLLLPPAEGYGC